MYLEVLRVLFHFLYHHHIHLMLLARLTRLIPLYLMVLALLHLLLHHLIILMVIKLYQVAY